MAEITSAAYADLRAHIEANWNYIELRDDLGAAVIRVNPTDPRVTWTHVPGSQTLELSIAVKGSDADINVPQAFNGSAIYGVATGGNPYSEEAFSSSFTIQADADELRVKHHIQVPQL